MVLPGFYPPCMAQEIKQRWQQVIVSLEEQTPPLTTDRFDDAFLAQLFTTWSGSEFVGDLFTRDTDYLLYFYRLYQQSNQMMPSASHRDELAKHLSSVESQTSLMRILRQYRNKVVSRLIWQDINGLIGLEALTQDLSALADACIESAVQWLYQDLVKIYGTPVGGGINGALSPQQIIVISMGKLGAKELNLSSDIDLMFAYPYQGETTGARRTFTNQEFFIKLGQQLIKVLDTQTADGFVFRVDMRLRPYGNSGALVLSTAAMEQYYQDQGRDWERYAMIKARISAGDKDHGKKLLAELKPFVYRRYIDFSAITALRDMKKLIEREVKRKGMATNIKLGPGGIREIEFIAQSFQLIHGGKDHRLQQRSLMAVLTVISENGYLPESVVTELVAAYHFLRKLEHGLQAFQDKQTQSLPEDANTRERIAFGMGFTSWQALLADLLQHRNHVMGHFANVISVSEGQSSSASTTDPWRAFWFKAHNLEEEQDLFIEKGFHDAVASHRLLITLRDGKPLSRVSRQSRERVDKFMPLLLEMISQSAQPDTVLQRLLPLIDSVLRRTAYLVLLMENPLALKHLCSLCMVSPWIANQIATMPALLDEFLNLGTLYQSPEKKKLAGELQQQLAHIPEDDLEQQAEALRYFKISHVLKVAAAHVTGRLALMKESDYLTWIAEVVLEQVVSIAWRSLTGRYGYPVDDNGDRCDSGFAVIGYGKLGGVELGPGSDLDLVFIHKGASQKETDGARKLDGNAFYARLGQRIIHILTTRSLSGELYQVDMRLRPSGASGLLVSSFSAYEKYQKSSAWTWEHQALVRARVVAGDKALADEITALRQHVLGQVRDHDILRQDVLSMRAKMREHLGNKKVQGLVDIKQEPGGIVDIEFLMQYAVLRYAVDYPNLINWTDNIRISEELEAAGLLSADAAQKLRTAYQELRLAGHKQSLQGEGALVPRETVASHLDFIRQLWQSWLLTS